MDRLLAAASAGTIAYMAALDAGLPAWRNLQIGDATDFGLTAAMLVWFTIGALRAQPKQSPTPKDSTP